MTTRIYTLMTILHWQGLALLSAAALLLMATLFSGCSREVEADANNTAALTTVYVAPIEKMSRPLPLRASGRLAAKAEIKMSFKIGGIIDRIYVDEGQYVRAGTRLARLNMAEIDAQVLQATSALEKAQRDLARVEGLYQDSVATLEQFQDAKTGVEIAEANVNIATFNREYAEIVAPSNGRVLRRMAEVNELTGAGQPIFVFGAEQSGWIVRVGLADRDIIHTAVGDSAHLWFDAYPDEPFAGRVTEVADAADAMSSTFEVEIAVEDKDKRLKSGFIARVDLFPSFSETVTYIPIEALVEGNGREGLVYVYNAETREATKVPVHIERILDHEIAVSGGLEAYDQVVTDGASFLKGDGVVDVLDAQ